MTTINLLKKNLRNQSVARIFATEWLRIKQHYIMRRDVFQAIADPTRRAIICLLAMNAMTPNAIAEHFNSSRQAVSKHIQILVECELLRQEQQGRELYYHLNANKIQEIDQWLEQFRSLLAKRFNQLDEVLTQIKNKK